LCGTAGHANHKTFQSFVGFSRFFARSYIFFMKKSYKAFVLGIFFAKTMRITRRLQVF